MSRFFSPALLAGLDIQSGFMRFVQLAKTNHGFKIERLAAIELPQELFVEGKIIRWDIVQARLTEWVEQLGINNLMVALQVPANLVRMQIVQLPNGLQPLAIEAEVYAHVQRELPRVAEKMSVDYVAFNPDGDYMDVFFAATREDYLSCYADCVAAAGLQVKVIDVDIYAIQRLLCFALNTKTVTACVVIIKKSVALMVFTAKEIIFHRSWEMMHGVSITQQLTLHLQTYATTKRFMAIDSYVYCGAADYLTTIQTVMPEAKLFDPLASMTIATTAVNDRTIFPTHEFMTACGLAMREVPSWL